MVVTALLFAACSGDGKVEFDDDALVAEMEGYASWDAAGEEGVVRSCEAAHGRYVQAWANATAQGGLAGGAWDDGAMLVLEGYQDAQGTFKSLVAMRRVDGLDPDHGDWYWAWLDEDGLVVQSGSLTGCVGCHEAEGGGQVRTVEACDEVTRGAP